MNSILVLTEHRRGILRDITYELLTLGKILADKDNLELN